MPEPMDVERSLRRVVVGYLVAGTIWLVILGIVTLADRSDPPDRPYLVVTVMLMAVAAAGAALWVQIRMPDLLRTWWFVAALAATGIVALLAPDLAGAQSFYGGYPLAGLFVAIYAGGSWPGLAVTVTLVAAAGYRVVQDDPGNPTVVTSSIGIYVFVWLAAAWAVAVIRRGETIRAGTEAALLESRERQARAEERAEMAAHLHDSVLQTLAVIQRRSDRPQEVTTLARRQERELRSWLYGTPHPGDATSFAGALRLAAAEVEQDHSVAIDIVTVGDCPADERIAGLIRAAREAMVNAAKHAGVPEFSVYGEAGAGRAAVYVRDRGDGFDPATAAEKGRGITDSIRGRVARLGGTVRIDSAPGRGTEVELVVPR